jgi:hypothetical protein
MKCHITMKSKNKNAIEQKLTAPQSICIKAQWYPLKFQWRSQSLAPTLACEFVVSTQWISPWWEIHLLEQKDVNVTLQKVLVQCTVTANVPRQETK